MQYTYNTTNSEGDQIAGFKAGDYLYNKFWDDTEWGAIYYFRFIKKRSIPIYLFRRGTVPGVHHYGGVRYFFRYYRQPKHLYVHKELGYWKVLQDEVYEHTNWASLKRQSRKQIPDPYDDTPRSDKYDRSWKKFRKHRWKDKK